MGGVRGWVGRPEWGNIAAVAAHCEWGGQGGKRIEDQKDIDSQILYSNGHFVVSSHLEVHALGTVRQKSFRLACINHTFFFCTCVKKSEKKYSPRSTFPFSS